MELVLFLPGGEVLDCGSGWAVHTENSWNIRKMYSPKNSSFQILFVQIVMLGTWLRKLGPIRWTVHTKHWFSLRFFKCSISNFTYFQTLDFSWLFVTLKIRPVRSCGELGTDQFDPDPDVLADCLIFKIIKI